MKTINTFKPKKNIENYQIGPFWANWQAPYFSNNYDGYFCHNIDPVSIWNLYKKLLKKFKLLYFQPIGRPPISQNGLQFGAPNDKLAIFFIKIDPLKFGFKVEID